jgi:hypothetical protein
MELGLLACVEAGGFVSVLLVVGQYGLWIGLTDCDRGIKQERRQKMSAALLAR